MRKLKLCQPGLYFANWWPTASFGGSFVAFWWLFGGLLAFWWLFGGSPVALWRLDVVNWWSSHPLPPSEAVSAIQSPRTPEERIRPPPPPSRRRPPTAPSPSPPPPPPPPPHSSGQPHTIPTLSTACSICDFPFLCSLSWHHCSTLFLF